MSAERTESADGPTFEVLARRLIEESTDYGVLFLDPGGIVRYANPGIERILGYAAAELVGRPGSIIFTDEDRAGGRPEQELATALAQGRAEDTRWHQRQDGTRVWVTGALVRIDGPGGELQAFAKILRDASSLRVARAEWQRRDEAYRLLVSHVQDYALFLMDREGRITEWGAGAQQLTGWSADEVAGQPLAMLYPEPGGRADDGTAEEHLAYAATHGEYAGTGHRRRRDGSLYLADVALTALRDEQGELVGFSKISRDLTETHAAEARLRASEARYRLLAEGLPLLVATVNRDGTVDYVNERWVAYTGLPLERIHRHGWLEAVHPEDVERARAWAREALREGRETDTEFRLRRGRDGVYRWHRAHAGPIRIDGEVVKAVNLAIDVEDQRRAEEALRQAQKLESIGVLAGGVAHDFNNLLTGIMGNVGLAARMLPPESVGRVMPLLQEALKAGERAADLTRQLLAYAGKGRFVIEPVDACRFLPEAAGFLRASVPANVELRFDLPERCPPVEADRGQLQQLVVNLVTNAAEAIGGAPGTVTIGVRAEWLEAERLARTFPAAALAEGPYLLLEVRDTGSGMDAETLGRIFDPFFTTKFMGRGLGLPAVLGIVRGHRGGLAVESAPGRGSTITVALPVAPSASDAPRPPASAPPARPLVLVADDEDGIRGVARAILEEHGYDVVLAADGRAAVERFAAQPDRIAVVLLDLTMPVLGGREAADAIWRLRPAARIVVTSGYGDTEALRRFEGTPVTGFLPKPFTEDRLAAAVRDALAAEPAG
ncbi:MAG TPA: PAS domain S-box protein [Gemmatimonadales bacterium]|nr:PAS domain S-box protein [Gemmatimonadales bacterium]